MKCCMKTNRNQILHYIVHRAIEENLSSLDSYDDLPIEKETSTAIDSMTARLYDLVDAHTDAKYQGDIEKSNQILGEIQDNEILRLLSAYHLDGGSA